MLGVLMLEIWFITGNFFLLAASIMADIRGKPTLGERMRSVGSGKISIILIYFISVMIWPLGIYTVMEGEDN